MTSLSILMLGSFQVTLDGQPVNGFESCKARALLAYLVMEARNPCPRCQVAGLLWPDLSEPAALGNLRHALCNLNHILGDHTAAAFIRAGHNDLQLDTLSDYYADVKAFSRLVKENTHGPSSIEQLEYAIAMYRGDFLQGLELYHCAEFEEWVLLRRENLNWLLMMAYFTLYEHYERTTQYDRAIDCAKQMVWREPWDEMAHQKLMRAYALSGHRGDALRQYIECRRLLQTELQVDPGPSTTALYERIRDGSFPDTALEQPLVVTQPNFVRNRMAVASRSRVQVGRSPAAKAATLSKNHG